MQSISIFFFCILFLSLDDIQFSSYVAKGFYSLDSIPLYIKYDTLTTLDTTGFAKTKCLTEIIKVTQTEIPFDDLKSLFPDCLQDTKIIQAYQMMIDQERRKKNADILLIEKWKKEGACWQ